MKENTRKVMNAVYAAAIAINTALVAVNLLTFDNVKGAILNTLCGILCWIGYFRTQEHGDEPRN